MFGRNRTASAPRVVQRQAVIQLRVRGLVDTDLDTLLADIVKLEKFIASKIK